MDELDIPGLEKGKRTERVEWGERSISDTSLVGPVGSVRKAYGEEQARGYDGAFYPGGPRVKEAVKRTVVTYTSDWEPA